MYFKREIIDLRAVPMFLELSRVDSCIVAIMAVVFSKLAPTELADEAVLDIASASSFVSVAVIFILSFISL